MATADLASLFVRGTTDEKKAWLWQTMPRRVGLGLPPESIAAFFDLQNVEGDLTALDAVVMALVHGGDSPRAVELGSTGRSVFWSAVDAGEPLSPSFLALARRIFSNLAQALQQVGEPALARRHVEEALARLPGLDSEARDELKGRIADSLLDEGRYPECEAFLEKNPELARSRQLVLQSVRERLRNTGSAVTLPAVFDESKLKAETAKRITTGLTEMLSHMSPELADKFRGQLEAMSQATVDPFAGFDKLAMLGGVQDDGAGPLRDELGMRARSMRAAKVLMEATVDRSREKLGYCLEQNANIVAFAREHAFPEDECSALWTMSICLRRLERWDEAERVLTELHERAWELRRQLNDPLRGIDFTSRFPHLFAVRCELLARAGKHEALFCAIEASKGQIIADTLEATPAGPPTAIPGEQDFALAIAACREHRFHYLTFFVDDAVVHAALVTKAGRIHTRALALGSNAISRYARYVDPSTWGKRLTLVSSAPSDMPDALAPLIDWLAPLLDQGELRTGDHLAYCPDGPLWRVPFQLLSFGHAPLARTFSLSRTNGIRGLASLLRRKPTRPAAFQAFEVTARGEPEDKRRAFERAGDYLAERLPHGERLRSERATVPAWFDSKLHDRVVHLATHGIFPEDGIVELDPNPLLSSGLLLASEGELPLRSVHCKSVLTPQLVLSRQAPTSLAGSHVTLQACVSGWSRAGSGRDALGLEWALGVKGAASVLSSNWHIDAETAAEFGVCFYREWLGNGASRAAAWQRASLSLMETRPELEWASFTLSGDFR